MDPLLLLADGQITMSLEWLGATILGVVGAVGGGAKLVWNYFTSKLNEQAKEFQDGLKAKDEQLSLIQGSLDRARQDHAAAVERLQNVTLTKMEQFNEKVVGLVERVVEQQAEVAVILRSVQVQIERGNGGSNSSDTGNA